MQLITLIDQQTSKTFSWYDNALGTILRQFEGFEFTNIITSVENLPSRIASHFSNSQMGFRRLSWSGDLVGADVFTKRRSMLEVMNPDGFLKLLQFLTYDGLALQCEVSIDKVIAPYSNGIHTYQIEAIAPDPRFYSQTEKTIEISPNTTEDCENEGNVDSFPIFEIHGPFTSLEVTNLDTNMGFTIVDTLIAGETLLIDSKNLEVKVNGVDAYSIFSGDFIKLISGSNNLQFDVVGSDGNTNMEVSYRDAYNGA